MVLYLVAGDECPWGGTILTRSSTSKLDMEPCIAEGQTCSCLGTTYHKKDGTLKIQCFRIRGGNGGGRS